MAYYFLDDGAPEADEYSSNFIYFDESKPECLKQLISEVRKLKHEKGFSKNQLRLKIAGCV